MRAPPHFLRHLELDLGADEPAIKRAYARKLKQIDQEADAAGFQALREAYEAALRWARGRAAVPAGGNAEVPIEAQPRRAEVREPREPVPLAPGSPAQPVDPPLRGAAEDRQARREESPEAIARAVLSQLAASLAAAPADFDAVKTLFQGAVGDSRLIRIEAKDLFERQIAQRLGAGWQPGNEFLLHIAARYFEWERDHRRLSRFGGLGVHLAQGIQQYRLFSQGEGRAHVREIDLIRALRSDARPSNRTLAKALPVLESLAGRYPVMFSLITSETNFERWRAWAREVPGLQQKLARSRYEPAAARKAVPDSRERRTGPAFGAAFLVIVVISGLSRLFTPSSPSSPPPSPAPRSASLEHPPLITSQGLKPREQPRAAGALAADAGKARPISDFAVLGRAFIALAEPPDAKNCREVAKLEQSHGAAWFYQSDAVLGTKFDRRIIDCSAGQLWPRGGEFDAVLQAAVARQRAGRNGNPGLKWPAAQ